MRTNGPSATARESASMPRDGAEGWSAVPATFEEAAVEGGELREAGWEGGKRG